MADLSAIAARLHVDAAVQLDSGRRPVLVADDEVQEELACTCPDVELVFGDNTSAGKGTLELTTRRIVWVSSQPAGPAFALRYQQVVMHAISRDPAAFAKPCIYLQLDEGSEQMMEQGEDEEEEEEDVSAEVRLIPAEEGKVDELFKALCDCAALNPDTDIEQEGEGDFFFDDAEVLAGLDGETRAAVMAARLEEGMDLGDAAPGDLEELMGEDPGRFDDCNEEDDEEEGQEEEEGGGAGGQPSAAPTSNGRH